jgi:hypothetical protein
MKFDHLVVVRRRRYRLRTVKPRQMRFHNDKPFGECDSPSDANKEIRILYTLRGVQLLEVIIHELLHAALWDIDEEAISEAARDIARILWKLGFRFDDASLN